MSGIPYDLIDMQAKCDIERARADDAEAALLQIRAERGDLLSELRDEQKRVRDCSAEIRDLRLIINELRKLRTDLAAAHDRDQNAVARRMDSIAGFGNW